MTTTRKTETTDNGLNGLFAIPSFDIDAALEAQRKNVEALVEANRVAFEGYKTAAEKQVEAARKMFEDATGVARETFSGKTPEANAQKQIDAAQGLAKSGFEHFREVAELALKSNREAFAVMQKRFNEGVEELKAARSR